MTIALGVLTILVLVMMWYAISKAMKFGKEQKSQQMLAWIYFFIFLTVIFLLLNLAHLFI